MTKQDIAENRKRAAASDSYLPIRQRESEVEGIGNRIQELRRNGESIAGFARRVGVPEANIHTYLRGMNPQVDKLVRIARACGVTVDWLATGRGERSATARQPVENKETAPRAAVAGGDVLDVDRLSAAITAIEEGLGGKPLPPRPKSRRHPPRLHPSIRPRQHSRRRHPPAKNDRLTPVTCQLESKQTKQIPIHTPTT